MTLPKRSECKCPCHTPPPVAIHAFPCCDPDISRQDEFIREMKSVMEKYGVEMEESDQYDNEENVCGTALWFKGKDIFCGIYDF